MLVSQYSELRKIKKTVNARRINRNTMQRKLRLASFVPAPILRKNPNSGFNRIVFPVK